MRIQSFEIIRQKRRKVANWKSGNEEVEKWFDSYVRQCGLPIHSLACQIYGTKDDLSAKCGKVIVYLRKDHIEIIGEIPDAIRKDLIGRTMHQLGNLYDTCSGVVAKNHDAFLTFARMYRHHLSSSKEGVVLTTR